VNLLDPEGLSGLIGAISDLETDAALADAQSSVGRLCPVAAHELSLYRDFFDTHGDAFDSWFLNQSQNHPQTLYKLFMILRSQQVLVSH
jgi:hypothetical protein